MFIQQQLDGGKSSIPFNDYQLSFGIRLDQQWLVLEVTIIGNRHGQFFDGHLFPEDLQQISLRGIFLDSILAQSWVERVEEKF